MKKIATLALILTVAACGRPAPDAPSANSAAAAREPQATASSAAATASPLPPRDYAGKWVGVEGMYLTVAPAAGDAFTLDMQWDLDHHGTFPGQRRADGIAFVRNGTAEVLSPTDGDATGLKYLAGKQDCLTVKPGEGYCRD